jgi:hypothetical protein
LQKKPKREEEEKPIEDEAEADEKGQLQAMPSNPQRQSPGGSNFGGGGGGGGGGGNNSNNKLARKDGGSTKSNVSCKQVDICGDWRYKINAQHFTATLSTMFQRLLSVVLPKVALFDAKNTDFASLSVRFRVAI